MELLIGVAIVALLLVLLVPVMSRSIEGARSSACIANLRALGGAFSAYSAEKNNFLPAPYDSTIGEYWADMLVPYLGGEAKNKVFGCPSLPRKAGFGGPDSYGMPRVENGGAGGLNTYAPLLRLENLSRQILVADSLFSFAGGKAQSWRFGTGQDNRLMHFRHGGSANILFMDMHVAQIRPEGLSEVIAFLGISPSGGIYLKNGPWPYYDQESKPRSQ